MRQTYAARPLALSLALTLCVACAPTTSSPRGAGASAPQTAWPEPIDPQRVRDQDDMTWDDYKPIPGADWTDPNHKGSKRQVRLAVITADFPDQPFVMTLPKKSDMFGNPQTDPITRDQVPQFFLDFYMKPNVYNHGHTIHEYWMEQSRGKVGISTTVFGPYRMPQKAFVYGMPQEDMPSGYTADNRGLQRQLDSLWQNEKGKDIAKDFDLVLRMYAGYDETATWQEFGEMKFQTPADVPAEWGNPDPTKPRTVRSRYGAMIPWKAGEWLWSNSAIVQGESINSIRHELGHAAFKIGDNYNNPFATPYRRAPAGPWELMDRGSFNGPGGPHKRYVVPPDQGGSMAAGQMLRQRMLFGFVDSSQVLLLNRHALAQSGLAVAEVTNRSISPLPGTLAGIHIRLDGDSGKRDLAPVEDPATHPLSPGIPNYDFYTVEVVQRIGYDSYEPDNGVLIAKNKDNGRSTTGGPNAFVAFTWVIDAHPEDINHLDFKRPNGEAVMRNIADYRQLNDALFHAGTNSGSQYEWEDTPNRLHFYVIDVHHDAKGLLSYTLAVKSLDGAGPQRRGVALTPAKSSASISARGQVGFTLTNTGQAAPVPASLHPTMNVAQYIDNDVYRLSTSVEGNGWSANLQNALAAVKFGGTQNVPVFVQRSPGAAASAVVTLTATSESDPSKTISARVTVR